MNSNEVIYRKYLSELKKRIVQRYIETGRKASGAFESELEDDVQENKMLLLGAAHSVFMEKGRGPGGWPPRKAIENWIDNKQGLPPIFKEKKDQFVFLISRKIALEGTKGSDVMETVIQEWIDKDMWKMLKEIGNEYAFRIYNDVVRLIKTFK